MHALELVKNKKLGNFESASFPTFSDLGPMTSNRRYEARIRPGGIIVIPRPILIALGWVPGEAMEVTIELRGNRLFIAKKPASGEAKLARFKASLVERLRHAKSVESLGAG